MKKYLLAMIAVAIIALVGVTSAQNEWNVTVYDQEVEVTTVLAW